MIEVNGLVKRFDGFAALDGAALSVPAGSVYGLVGPNGAGKSTLIRHLTGIFRQDAGTVRIGGEDVWENAALKARIAAIPDDWYYFLQSSIRDMMRFYRGFYPAFSMERYEKLKEVFQLDEKRPIRRLSKGMQKQAAFWLALCCMPDYLILDEPVDGLDPVMRRQVWSLVLAGCALVCCVLHFDLLGVADRVPEASQIQTLEIRIADNTYTLTPEKDADLLEQVRALHQTVVADESYVREMEARRSSTWSEDETPNTAYTGLNLTYTLKSGIRIDRWYSLLITRDRLAQPETYDYLLDQFVNSDTVKARRLHLDDDFWTVSGGSLYIDTRGEGYELGSREGDAILKAVGRDLTAGNWGDYDWFSGDSGSSYAMDLGLDFESADRERYDWISVHVTPAMTETVDCLERLGLVTRADLVTYRQLYPDDYGADGSSIWQEVPHTGENAVVYTEDTTSAMVSPA